jgi:hypothetical protein
MNGMMLIYGTDGAFDIVSFTERPTLVEVQQAVGGGYIEQVPFFNTVAYNGEVHHCLAFCDEDGKRKELPYNQKATELWDLALRRMRDIDGDRVYPDGLTQPNGDPTDVLVGPIAVMFGDEDFMDAV